MLSRDDFVRQIRSIHAVLAASGFDVRPLIIDAPASVEQVAWLEDEIGVRLPESFRHALLHLSSRVDFAWFLPDDVELPAPFQGIFSGDLHWSLELTARYVADVKSWVDNVFPNADDPYDAVWHDKAAFYEVGNGDYLAFDLDESSVGKVVYLSHDGGEGHGYVLAPDFGELLDRWLPLACVGGEDWQWLPFTSSPTSTLDPTGEAAVGWRKLVGLDGMHQR